MAFYLKYRPKTISELDVAQVREGLFGVLQAGVDGKLPHALLFTGPRGSGKTSSARLLAKAVNCERQLADIEMVKRKIKNQKPNLEPCNTCEACLAIDAGRSMDVIEIDAASHRGIDDIRDLREKVRLSPIELKYKVYIIDEVHMLTNEAFNALLKTLEEPPANVLFILCTTELHKLPETIVSRCVRIPFVKGTREDVMHCLNRVVEGENLQIDDDVLRLISEKVDGSFRDAHKVLEQLSWRLSEESPRITLELAKSLLGIVENRVNELVEMLDKKDIGGVIQLIEVIMDAGENLKSVIEGVLHNFHSEILQRIKKQESGIKKLKIEELRSLIKYLDRSLFEMKSSAIEQLPVELVVLEWEQELGIRSQKSGVQEFRNQKEEQLRGSTVLEKAGSEDVKTVSSQSVETVMPTFVSSNDDVGGEISLEKLNANWKSLLDEVKNKNYSVQALLRSSKPVSVEGAKVVIEVWYPFHLEKLNSYSHRHVVEGVMGEMFGCAGIHLEYILTKKEGPGIQRKNNVPEEEVPWLNGTQTKKSNGVNKVSDKPYGGGYVARNNIFPSPNLHEQDEELIQFAEDIFGS